MFFFGFNEFKKREKIDISNLYNSTIIKHSVDNKAETQESLIKIINKKDSTYSPLSLYFIIDNEIIKDKNEVNKLFDIIINKTSLENEIKNLIIYKKALFNADQSNENELLDILKPLINSESVWKSHALYLWLNFFIQKMKNKNQKNFLIKLLF